jgi:hypothetical protein
MNQSHASAHQHEFKLMLTNAFRRFSIYLTIPTVGMVGSISSMGEGLWENENSMVGAVSKGANE